VWKVHWEDVLAKGPKTFEAGIVVVCRGPDMMAGPGLKLMTGGSNNQVHVSRYDFIAEPGRLYSRKPKGALVSDWAGRLCIISSGVPPFEDPALSRHLEMLDLELPPRHDAGGIALLDRREVQVPDLLAPEHAWSYKGARLQLLGENPLLAYETAYEGLRRIFSLAEIVGHPARIADRTLPGEFGDSDKRELLVGALDEQLGERYFAETLVRRWGARAGKLLTDPRLLERIAPHVLMGELQLGKEIEQAVTSRDFFCNRLGFSELEYANVQDEPTVRELFQNQKS
jgi:hypothetical protein